MATYKNKEYSTIRQLDLYTKEYLDADGKTVYWEKDQAGAERAEKLAAEAEIDALIDLQGIKAYLKKRLV